MSDLFKAEASKPFRRHLDLLRLMRCAPVHRRCVRVCTCVNMWVCVRADERRRANGMLRRLADDEKPLQLCLGWSDDGADSLNRRQFVLQDNVTSDIAVRHISHTHTHTHTHSHIFLPFCYGSIWFCHYRNHWLNYRNITKNGLRQFRGIFAISPVLIPVGRDPDLWPF